jgi:hypothetical protein
MTITCDGIRDKKSNNTLVIFSRYINTTVGKIKDLPLEPSSSANVKPHFLYTMIARIILLKMLLFKS